MLLDIVNYASRLILVLLGVWLIAGFFIPKELEGFPYRLYGVVLLLFGIYRLSMYSVNRKRRKKYFEDIEDDINPEKEDDNEKNR